MLINKLSCEKSLWRNVREEYRNIGMNTFLRGEDEFYMPGASLEITNRGEGNPCLAVYVGSNYNGEVFKRNLESPISDMSQGDNLDWRKEKVKRVISTGPMTNNQYKKFGQNEIYHAEVKNILGNLEFRDVGVFGNPLDEDYLEGNLKFTAHFGINEYFPKLGDRLEESREKYDVFLSWKGERIFVDRYTNSGKKDLGLVYFNFSPLLNEKFHPNEIINEFICEHIQNGFKYIIEKIRNPEGLPF